MADLESKIRKQIEFYFGDSNFPKDKFLRAQAAQNEQGYVAIATLLTFKKMTSICDDPVKIVAAIKDSDFVDVNQEGTMIKRKSPLPENDTSAQRTIYAKGFVPGTSIEDIGAKFAHIGKVLSVRIRKFADKKPKPSALIEFSTVEEAKKAVTEKIQIDGVDLQLLSKEAFVESKKKQKKKKRKKRERKVTVTAKKKKKITTKKKQKKEREEKKFPAGVFLSFKEIGPGITREHIKEIFGSFENSTVAFVDFEKEHFEGVARFENAEAAKRVLDGMTSSKKEIGGKIPILAILEGEDEEAQNQKVKESQNQRFNKGKKSMRGKKRQRF